MHILHTQRMVQLTPLPTERFTDTRTNGDYNKPMVSDAFDDLGFVKLCRFVCVFKALFFFLFRRIARHKTPVRAQLFLDHGKAWVRLLQGFTPNHGSVLFCVGELNPHGSASESTLSLLECHLILRRHLFRNYNSLTAAVYFLSILLHDVLRQ